MKKAFFTILFFLCVFFSRHSSAHALYICVNDCNIGASQCQAGFTCCNDFEPGCADKCSPVGSSCGVGCTSDSQCSYMGGTCIAGSCQASSTPDPPSPTSGGINPIGASCNHDYTCASGLCDPYPWGPSSVCVSTLPNGAPCDTYYECNSGACISGVCSNPLPNGAACQQPGQCQSGNCQVNSSGGGRTCQSSIPSGGSCGSPTESCNASEFCNLNTLICEPRRPNGAGCQLFDWCISGVCSGSLCVGSGAPGDSCTNSNQCSVACLNGTCGCWTNGNVCLGDSYCCSGNCDEGICRVGSPIVPTASPAPIWECPSGYNQQCIDSAFSCSEMRIANCGVCGGSSDCCCTSSVPGGLCPNGTCDASESCSTCESDCGVCAAPTPATPPGGPVMRTLTGILFIDGAGGTANQQDVGESCYDQPATIWIEDIGNGTVYTTTAAVVAGCATYSQQVPNGRTYRISITGLSNYQATGWNNGQGTSSSTLPAQVTLN